MFPGTAFAQLYDPVHLLFYISVLFVFVGLPICEAVPSYSFLVSKVPWFYWLLRTSNSFANWFLDLLPMWYSSLLLGITSLFGIYNICASNAKPFRARHRPKKRKARNRLPKPPYVFHRRKLPYHLVMRCYARKGNRPERIFGPSRRELLLVRREKRRRYRHKRAKREARLFYEALISVPRLGKNPLHEPDINLILPLLDRLGPGGIPLPLVEEFALESSTPSLDICSDLSTRALFVGQRLNQVQTGSVLTTPLVFRYWSVWWPYSVPF